MESFRKGHKLIAWLASFGVLSILLAPASNAATTYAHADANAITVLNLGTGTYASDLIDTKEVITGNNKPILNLPTLGLVNVGVLSQDATTGGVPDKYGTAAACAGLAGDGSTLLGLDTEGCLDPQNTISLSLGSIDLGGLIPTIPGVPGLPTNGGIGDIGLFVDLGVIEGWCKAAAAKATGGSKLAGAKLYAQLGTTKITLIDFPVAPAPNTELVANMGTFVQSIVDAIKTQLTDTIIALLGGPLVAGVIQLVADLLVPIMNTVGSLLAPLTDQVIKVTFNKQVFNADKSAIHVTAFELNLLAITSAFGFGAMDLKIGDVNCSSIARLPGGNNGGNPLQGSVKDASSTKVAPGESFDYEILVMNNNSTCALNNVKITDTLTGPAGTTVTTTEPAGINKDSHVVSGRTTTIKWSGAKLAPLSAKTIKMRVKVPADANIGVNYNNKLSITATDCNGKDWSITDEVNNPEVTDPGNGPCKLLASNGSASNKAASHLEVKKNQEFVWLIHLYNAGGQNCTGVKVVDKVDSRADVVSCNLNCSISGQTVSWSGLTVRPGQSMTLTIVAKPNAKAQIGDVLYNRANISGDQPGANGYVDVNLPKVSNNSVPAPPCPAGTPLANCAGNPGSVPNGGNPVARPVPIGIPAGEDAGNNYGLFAGLIAALAAVTAGGGYLARRRASI